MTTKTVDVNDARVRLAELLDEVAAGTEVILMEDNEPRARLVAIALDAEPVKQRIPNLHPGSMTMCDDFDDPLPDEFWTGELCIVPD